MFDPRLDALAERIFTGVKSNLGERWQDRWGPRERELIRACCQDAAELQLKSLAASPTPEAQAALLRSKAQINAQLCNIAAAGSSEVADALWSSVRLILSGALSVAIAVV